MSDLKLVPYDGEKPYVFVSYAHRDMKAVYSILRDLAGKGMRIWFDEGIDPGTEWDNNIAEHVNGCDSVIAFISANYLASDNCRDELNYARDLKKDRLLIYLEPVELPAGMAMRMNRIQAVNHFRYDRPEDFRAKLMQCRFLARSMDTAGSEPAATPEEETEDPVQLGKKYLSGNGVPKNPGEAVRLFRLAAERNDPEALYNLGRCYATGRGVPQDYREAEKWHLKAAELNQVESQRALGHMYVTGRPGLPKNPEEGARWYGKAAIQGDTLSQASLGECCENGWGVPQDYPEAVRWYLKSADGGLGCDISRYHLGKLYLAGSGVEKDEEEAVRWLEKAGGNPDALNLLGTCYENGYGVRQNPEEAAELYRRAAGAGHVTAQFNLANCYLNGSGVDRDPSEAFAWYRKAAENTVSFDGSGPLWFVDQPAAVQGQILARKKLAECFRKGIGTEPDEAEAQRWETAASEHPDVTQFVP